MRKFKCVGYKQDYEKNFTVGKIYECKEDGKITCDDGYTYDNEETVESMIKFLSRYYNFEEITEEKKNNMKFKVGDVVEILDGKSGAYGGDGRIGIITDKPSNNGLSFYKEGINIDLGYRGVWKVGLNAKLKLISSSTQSFTITVSDTTTTLKSADKTVSINRYYEDKHDVKLAIDYVVKKYFDEIERIKTEDEIGDKLEKLLKDNGISIDDAKRILDNKTIRED